MNDPNQIMSPSRSTENIRLSRENSGGVFKAHMSSEDIDKWKKAAIEYENSLPASGIPPKKKYSLAGSMSPSTEDLLQYVQEDQNTYQGSPQTKGRIRLGSFEFLANKSKRRAHSVDLDYSHNHAERESMLIATQAKCIQDIEEYIPLLQSAITKNKQDNKVDNVLSRLAIYVDSILSFSLDDIVEGSCNELVEKLQKLQQSVSAVHSPGRTLATKLLIILSRVSRLVEHLFLAVPLPTIEELKESKANFDISIDSSDDISEEDLTGLSPDDDLKLEANILYEKTSPLRIERPKRRLSLSEPTYHSPDQTLFSSFVDKIKQWTDNFAKKEEQKSTVTPQKTETIKFAPYAPKKPAIKPDSSPKIDLLNNEEELLCRICEEYIPPSNKEEHYKICAIEKQNESLVLANEERMKKIIDALENRMTKCETKNREQIKKHKIAGYNQDNNLLIMHETMVNLLDSLKNTLEQALDYSFVDNLNSTQLSVYTNDCTELLNHVEKNCKNYPKIIKTMNTFVNRIITLLNEKKEIIDEMTKSGIGMKKYENSKKLCREDFEILKPISKGAFGRVFLAKKIKTGDIYAIKVLNKQHTRLKKQIDHIKAERMILANTNNPFIVKFFYSFQTKQNLYMVMEYIPGGDLYSLLRVMGYFEESMAKSYIAELILALEYLHGIIIVHRDLKPDNILIGKEGHIKLTDFGLSRYGLIEDYLNTPLKSADTTRPMSPTLRTLSPSFKCRYSFVGTPDYLAPEVILGTGHDTAADWWSVGVILYEFLCGIPPFNDSTPDLIFENILNRAIEWPEGDFISPHARDFIEKLLVVDPSKRLTNIIKIKQHPFFEDINWETLLTTKAKFVPRIENEQDTSYFDNEERDLSTEFGETQLSGDFFNTQPLDSDSEGESFDSDDSDSEDTMEDYDIFLNFSYKNLPSLQDLTAEAWEKESSPKPPQKYGTSLSPLPDNFF